MVVEALTTLAGDKASYLKEVNEEGGGEPEENPPPYRLRFTERCDSTHNLPILTQAAKTVYSDQAVSPVNLYGDCYSTHLAAERNYLSVELQDGQLYT